ncbi:RelA/SpoT domain-containing protein [Rhodovulum strictum]|uniref:(P)ppGpp synthetase n=1 Tax=Rhodovulum strictum TaxID=58314 RepID=A0A844BJF9_9RHOB|nr:(p)ppGpp synthetase [Rhodovulum strictum]
MPSKSEIDKAGRILSDPKREYDETALKLDFVFADFRKEHLAPLTRLTLELQRWLQTYGGEYYIAQRLKRQPQILRKLRRLSVRLTQLQDIGGARIIVESNSDVDRLIEFLEKKFNEETYDVVRKTDYREMGRDDTGYRAFHFILDIDGYKIELQLRSRIQHYWSESIERTFVIYGYRLKEKEGDPEVIQYFKTFSDVLFSIENGRSISREYEIAFEQERQLAEAIISASRDGRNLSGFVNEGIIKTMAEKEGHGGEELSNWILVFDWTDGNFVTWDVVGRDADQAIEKYTRYELDFPEEEKYEVVMIGSSDISTVRHTHSHYFGIEHHNEALEAMDSSIIGLSSRMSMDVGARRILSTLKRRRYWGKNTIKVQTLKNHYCQNIASFDYSLQVLRDRGFIIGSDPISLDIKKNGEIADLV